MMWNTQQHKQTIMSRLYKLSVCFLFWSQSTPIWISSFLILGSIWVFLTIKNPDYYEMYPGWGVYNPDWHPSVVAGIVLNILLLINVCCAIDFPSSYCRRRRTILPNTTTTSATTRSHTTLWLAIRAGLTILILVIACMASIFGFLAALSLEPLTLDNHVANFGVFLFAFSSTLIILSWYIVWGSNRNNQRTEPLLNNEKEEEGAVSNLSITDQGSKPHTTRSFSSTHRKCAIMILGGLAIATTGIGLILLYQRGQVRDMALHYINPTEYGKTRRTTDGIGYNSGWVVNQTSAANGGGTDLQSLDAAAYSGYAYVTDYTILNDDEEDLADCSFSSDANQKVPLALTVAWGGNWACPTTFDSDSGVNKICISTVEVESPRCQQLSWMYPGCTTEEALAATYGYYDGDNIDASIQPDDDIFYSQVR